MYDMNIWIGVIYTLTLGITIAVNGVEKQVPYTEIVFLHLIRKHIILGKKYIIKNKAKQKTMSLFPIFIPMNFGSLENLFKCINVKMLLNDF